MDRYKFAVAVSSGMETVVKREMERNGYGKCPAVNGRIYAEGSSVDIVELNMSLRAAERILIVLAEGEIQSFDELYERAYSVDWKRFIDKDGRLAVSGSCVKSKLFSVISCQKIVKKAIVDKLMKQYSVNTLSETGFKYDIGFSIHEDKLVLTLDTSGNALHKRGYRDLSVAAPMKESIAAGIIMLSDWGFKLPFVDLCCGSGTLPIEAALYAKNIAPNKGRSFACEKWKGFIDAKERERIYDKLVSREYKEGKYDILGRDIDSDCVSISKRHAKRAGVGDIVRFETGDLGDYYSKAEGGTIISNLPYGERLLSANQLTELHKKLGNTFKGLKGWSGAFLTASPVFEKEFGRRCDKKRKMYNGDIECQVFMYYKGCFK